ncbi:hypothetical protein ACHAPF_004769 [Botrytis cinerea]
MVIIDVVIVVDVGVAVVVLVFVGVVILVLVLVGVAVTVGIEVSVGGPAGGFTATATAGLRVAFETGDECGKGEKEEREAEEGWLMHFGVRCRESGSLISRRDRKTASLNELGRVDWLKLILKKELVERTTGK